MQSFILHNFRVLSYVVLSVCSSLLGGCLSDGGFYMRDFSVLRSDGLPPTAEQFFEDVSMFASSNRFQHEASNPAQFLYGGQHEIYVGSGFGKPMIIAAYRAGSARVAIIDNHLTSTTVDKLSDQLQTAFEGGYRLREIFGAERFRKSGGHAPDDLFPQAKRPPGATE